MRTRWSSEVRCAVNLHTVIEEELGLRSLQRQDTCIVKYIPMLLIVTPDTSLVSRTQRLRGMHTYMRTTLTQNTLCVVRSVRVAIVLLCASTTKKLRSSTKAISTVALAREYDMTDSPKT